MTTYGSIPFQSVIFDEDGKLKEARPSPPDVTDLIIISHGWNNDADEATGLYEELLTNLSSSLEAAGGPNGRTFAAIGVYWPSKKFDFDGRGQPPSGYDNKEAAKGGVENGVMRAASANSIASPVVDNAMKQLSALYNKPADQGKLSAIQALVESRKLDDNHAGVLLVGALRDLLAGVEQSELDGSKAFFNKDKGLLYEKAQQPIDRTLKTVGAGGDGDRIVAKSIGNVLNKIESGFANLLNVGSYYTMKERASIVGAAGLAPCIDHWAEALSLKRVHLIGHSFGARLVTAAAMGTQTGKLSTMSLLQAAFSHNGFAVGKITGYFRDVVSAKRIKGPIMVTFSTHDSAVGTAYAIASRLSGTNSKAIDGGPNDQFGGLGANGALHMQEGESASLQMLANGQPYTLSPGVFHNLESSRFIASHGNVRDVNVAWAIASALHAAP
ncbi:alpha/beta fold hydrolase [Massilia sp. S19_KUP03_FR1]|uniref:alpha/beta fold hydrolase n=1 Tax=Massilia sp. S19_KUP03_FR1 TaxID=3025503 RepID=UPI002FCD59C8